MAISGCQPVLSLPRAHGDGTGSTVGLQWLNRHCSPWLLFSCRQEKAAALPGWVATVCHQCLTKMTPRFKKTPNHRTPRKAPLPKSSAGFTQPGPSLSPSPPLVPPGRCFSPPVLSSSLIFFFNSPALFVLFCLQQHLIRPLRALGPTDFSFMPSCDPPAPSPASAGRVPAWSRLARCHRPSATEPQLAPAACRDRHASPPPAPWPEQLRG